VHVNRRSPPFSSTGKFGDCGSTSCVRTTANHGARSRRFRFGGKVGAVHAADVDRPSAACCDGWCASVELRRWWNVFPAAPARMRRSFAAASPPQLVAASVREASARFMLPQHASNPVPASVLRKVCAEAACPPSHACTPAACPLRGVKPAGRHLLQTASLGLPARVFPLPRALRSRSAS
jgi:hypothetical protein